MTDASKKKARVNKVLVHGVYAKDVLMPWDDQEDFERLHEELKVEFFPRGAAEEEAVFDLALLHWQKRGVWRLRPAAALSDPFTHDIVQTGRKSWSGIRKALRAAAKGKGTLQGLVDANMASMWAQVEELQKKLADASTQDEIKLLEGKIDALHRTIAERVLPLTQALAQAPDAEGSFEKATGPESLERVFRLETMLDARIAKVLARLVGLKEFKRTPAAKALPGNN